MIRSRIENRKSGSNTDTLGNHQRIDQESRRAQIVQPILIPPPMRNTPRIPARSPLAVFSRTENPLPR